jgi:hypothetical protein
MLKPQQLTLALLINGALFSAVQSERSEAKGFKKMQRLCAVPPAISTAIKNRA